ncbi:MAG TPA: hypothetical protein VG895_03755 [Patescibacteria group bacterium]|nr:hypothetical protein [Patescibacteria group bacterium]
MSEIEKGSEYSDRGRFERERAGGGSPRSGIDMWLHCKKAIPQVDVLSEPRQSEGPREGFNSDYSCDDPNIVKLARESGRKIDSYSNKSGKVVFEAVEMVAGGDYRMERIQSGVWCAKINCPFFELRES